MTLKEPPPLGSPRELLLVLLWLQKEQMEHAQTHALLQTLIDKEKGIEAYEVYKKIRFPWIVSATAKEKSDTIKKLLEEIKKGALAVSPMEDPSKKMRSRLKARVIERSVPQSQQTVSEQKKIYSKIGMAVPIR